MRLSSCEVDAVALGGVFGDREAEAAAFRVRAFDAEEAVEHARQQVGRECPGPLSTISTTTFAAVGEQPDVDDAVVGRVAQSVVEQVVQQAAQLVRIGADRRVDARRSVRDRCRGDRRNGIRSEIRSRRNSASSMLDAASAFCGASCRARRSSCSISRFVRFSPASNCATCCSRLGVHRTRLQILELQRHRRDRRAQLVRGVLHEAALRGERIAQSRQQPVDGHDERTDLARHVLGRQLADRVLVLRSRRARDAPRADAARCESRTRESQPKSGSAARSASRPAAPAC